LWVKIRGCPNAHGGSFVPGGVRIVSYEPYSAPCSSVPNTNRGSGGGAPILRPKSEQMRDPTERAIMKISGTHASRRVAGLWTGCLLAGLAAANIAAPASGRDRPRTEARCRLGRFAAW
jgi:hypothetical protein